MNYKFYMQECDKEGNLLAGSTKKDLEVDFEGLRYASMDGILTIGKPKNITTETFTDSQRQRVWIPEEITNEATKINFKCYFFGDNCEDTFTAFSDYIRKGFRRYWDTARKRWFAFYCGEEIKVTSSMMKGKKYLEATFILNNIFGRTFNVE